MFHGEKAWSQLCMFHYVFTRLYGNMFHNVFLVTYGLMNG